MTQTISRYIISIVLLQAAVIWFTPYAQAASIQLADPYVESVVCESLGIPLGPVPEEQLLLLTSLSLDGDGEEPIDLTGLEHAANLGELNLKRCSFVDFTQLGSLTALRKLDFYFCTGVDVGYLATLTGLTDLTFNSNGLSNFMPLAALVGLESLVFRSDRPNDLSFLQSLTSLKVLGLIYAGVEDADLPAIWQMSQLEELELPNLRKITTIPTGGNLPNLRRLNVSGSVLSSPDGLAELTSLVELDLSNSTYGRRPGLLKIPLSLLSNMSQLETLNLETDYLTEIDALADLNKLKSLNIRGTTITDLSVLAGLTAMEELYLLEEDILEIEALANMPLLRVLSMDYTGVTSLAPLEGLTKLESLTLQHSPITDLSPIANCTGMRFMDLMAVDVNDLSPMAGFNQLEELHLSSLGTLDLGPLGSLTGLKYLYLDRTVSAITFLANLVNLEVLTMNDMSLTNIYELANLVNLTRLDLDHNFINDLSPLAALEDLRELSISMNLVTDISVFREMPGLRKADIEGNMFYVLEGYCAWDVVEELSDRVNFFYGQGQPQPSISYYDYSYLHFVPEEDRAPNAILNESGIPNLLAFGMGQPLDTFPEDKLPVIGMEADGTITYTYYRNLYHRVYLDFQVSTDCIGWTDIKPDRVVSLDSKNQHVEAYFEGLGPGVFIRLIAREYY